MVKCVRCASEWVICVWYGWKLGDGCVQDLIVAWESFGDYVREALIFDFEPAETRKPHEFVSIFDLFW